MRANLLSAFSLLNLMLGEFNPYSDWFGIAEDQQPPNHYVLLGLDEFESDSMRIDEAAEKRASFLQDVSSGPHTKQSQELLNQVASARLTLMDATNKSKYDLELKQSNSNPDSDSGVRKRVWAKKSDSASKHPSAPKRPPGDPPKARRKPQQAPAADTNDKSKTESGADSSAKFAVNIGEPASRSGGNRTASATRSGANKSHVSANPSGKANASKRNLVLAIAGGSIVAIVCIVGAMLAMSGQPEPDSRDATNSAAISNKDSNRKSGKRNRSANTGLVASRLDSPKTTNTKSTSKKKDSSSEKKRSPKTKSVTNKTPDATHLRENWPPINSNAVSQNGLVLWLDASDIDSFTLTNNKVSQWRDKSGTGFVAQQKNAARQPTYELASLAGRPTVSFSQEDRTFMSIASKSELNLGNSYTIVTVGATDGKGVYLAKGLPHKQENAFSLNSGLACARVGERKFLNSGESELSKKNFKCRIFVADGTSSFWHIDSEEASTEKEVHLIKNDNPLILGKREGSRGLNTNVKFSELLFYNRPLNASELKTLYEHLHKKWLVY